LRLRGHLKIYSMNDWYSIKNINAIDSPALVVYPARIKQNIAFALQMVGDVSRLRPHVKTNKMAEVCRLMMDAGITKFKCATIAEAEMLAQVGAPDVLLAYQPVGPKMERLIKLVKTYPNTSFSCLIDNELTALQLSNLCEQNSVRLPLFVDVNNGMNRTGIASQKVMDLLRKIKGYKGIQIIGLHGYDGHIRDSDIAVRQAKSDEAFKCIEALRQHASELLGDPLKIIMGGSPTFPTHTQRAGVECSPGTFVFWDWGYKHFLPDEPFEYAALLISRVISVIDEQTICTDLGHKSVAAENPLPRVHFLNAPDAIPIAQSEEHLVLKVPEGNSYKVGDLLYGVPVHICPTVALYDKAFVIENKEMITEWKVVGRNRSINI
jgi:D-serine deaminase-like pyridoxal phosphate-dependent protein